MSLLSAIGYSRLEHYPGGIRDWTAAGLGLESAPPAEAVAPPAPLSGLTLEPTAVAPLAGLRRRSRQLPVLDALASWTVGQWLILWLVGVLAFGLIYWLASLAGSPLKEGTQGVPATVSGFLVAEYFSFVTALSLGYGDVVPEGWVRVVAIAEAAMGLLVFGGVVSKFVSRRQEQLISEIHLTTFMDRLARVRANLHMVLSELHALFGLCSEAREPLDRVAVRSESLALVFIGELRSIHDLLYRPQMTPDEPILEGLLAELAAVLAEFSELLNCLPVELTRSGTLADARRAIAQMATEICGQCVPREYAPALRVWMDRIQALGGRLAGRPEG